MTLLVGSIFHMTRKIVSEMTYNVSMGTLNPTIPYHTYQSWRPLANYAVKDGVFAGKTVWSTPERLRGEVLHDEALYKSTFIFYLTSEAPSLPGSCATSALVCSGLVDDNAREVIPAPNFMHQLAWPHHKRSILWWLIKILKKAWIWNFVCV